MIAKSKDSRVAIIGAYLQWSYAPMIATIGDTPFALNSEGHAKVTILQKKHFAISIQMDKYYLGGTYQNEIRPI